MAHEGATAEGVVAGLRQVSPVCVMEIEAQMLTRNVHAHMAIRERAREEARGVMPAVEGLGR